MIEGLDGPDNHAFRAAQPAQQPGKAPFEEVRAKSAPGSDDGRSDRDWFAEREFQMAQVQLPNGWRFVDSKEDSARCELDPTPSRFSGETGYSGSLGSVEDVLQAAEEASRRMEVLARELHCLGIYPDGDDGPRAA